MIGEIRTRATAHYAFEAAMTGHQVLTTVHANDALGIVPRLMDIGVETYKLRDFSLVCGLVAQRLIRRLCQKCRLPLRPKVAGLRPELASYLEAALPDQVIWLRGAGCPDCRDGFDGRTVIAELVRPDQHLLELLCAGERQSAWEYWTGQLAGKPFRHHALQKIGAGIVDPRQIEAKLCRLGP
jgi:type II secretory ATPase GspE/PulE/Tfp pilus assembly ATPase PilB-like protein